MPTLIAVHPENDPRGDGLELAKASGDRGRYGEIWRDMGRYDPRGDGLELAKANGASRLCLGCTSAAPRLYLGRTSAVPRPYLRQAYAAATGGDRAGVLESSFVAEVKSDLMGEKKGLT